MFGLGMPELIVILVIVVVLFGAYQIAGNRKGDRTCHKKL